MEILTASSYGKTASADFDFKKSVRLMIETV